jgi:hypothetical protein
VIEETGTNNMIYTNRNDFDKWMERATTAERQLKELRDLVNAENQGEEPK